MTHVTLLGPQRLAPTVRDALDRVECRGPSGNADDAPVAAITAGWEERESEHDELGAHIGRPVVNLELYRRADDVFQHDPELFAALQERHDQLHELQGLYRVRLRHLVPAAEELLRFEGSPELIETEREAAFENLRALDDHHLARIAQIQSTFEERWQLGQRPSLARHRQELTGLLASCAALCIAGGHVGILFNRLWLFDVLGLMPGEMPIVAWSAGAMALAERIVLFHDSPPQGEGYAEVFGPGLAVCKGVVPLPHARQRLHVEDPIRMQRLKRRFPDAICVALDENDRLTWDGQTWVSGEGTKHIAVSGELVAMGGTA